MVGARMDMKQYTRLGRVIRVAKATLPLVCLANARVFAEPLGETADRQVAISARTATVAEQLDGAIAEFRENGLGGGEDVRTLSAVRDVLGKLSAEQMRRVADLLRQDHVGEAHAGQQDIVAQLGALLRQYQRQQAAGELAGRLNALADRQAANLRTTVEQSRTKGPKGRSVEDRDQMRAAQAEQRRLQADVATAMADLKGLAKQADADPTAAAAAEHADEVARRAATAADDLKADRPMVAAAGEQAVRDALRDMARQVGPAVSRDEQLQQAAERIDQAIAEQKGVLAQTQGTRDKPQLAAAEHHQAEVADQTEQAKRDAADAAPAAAGPLKNAADAMRQADASLSNNRRDQAAKQEQAALAQLEQARAAVAEQAKQDAPAVADGPQKDPAARAGDLQKQQQALANKTEAARKDHVDPAALAAEQAKLGDQAQDLKADVGAKNPEAAKAIDAAAGQMAAAQKSLEQGHRAEAVAKQKAAADQLAKAGEAIQQRQAAAAKQQDATAKAESARDQVAAAMVKQANAMASTAGGAKGAGEQQRAAKGAADAAQDAVKELPQGEAASKAVNAARGAMEDAQRKVDADDRANALVAQREALTQLAAAKGALDEQLAAAKGLKVPGNAAALSAVTSQLQAAGDLATKAAGEAKGGQAQAASGDLQQAMAAASKASASDQGLLGQSGRQAMEQAQGDLKQAADALAKGQSNDAAGHAEAARAAMANAMMAAQVAAAGQPTPGQPTPGQPMPGQPRNDGDKATPGAVASAAPSLPRGDVHGGGAFVGLPPRDRAAVEQAQRDPVPAAYGGMVEQYYRNLADGGK